MEFRQKNTPERPSYQQVFGARKGEFYDWWLRRAQPVEGTQLFLCFDNRSGSNLIAQYLIATGRFRTEDLEPLNINIVTKVSRQENLRCLTEYLQYLRDRNQIDGDFLVKVGLWQFHELFRNNRIYKVFAKPRFVWIRRRDVILQAISMWIAKQTKAWRSFHEVRGTAHYDFSEIKNILCKIIAAEKEFQESFAARGITPYEIYYEDFLSSPKTHTASIMRWADCKFEEIDESKIQGVTQGNKLNQEWRQMFIAELTQSSKDVELMTELDDRGLIR